MNARRAFLLVVTTMLLARTASAMTIASPLSLDTVTKESGRIVHATVTDVRSGRDTAGLPATWVTLQVTRTLKGTASPTVTVKQFGTSDTGGANGLLGGVPGLPRYDAGEQVVLFLRPESGRGFTSPVGLEQGVYRVKQDAGRRTARSAGAEGGSEELAAFLARVERLVAQQRRH